MNPAYVAFEDDRLIGSGELADVARAAKLALDLRKDAVIQLFDGTDSRTIELDFRGSLNDVLGRLPRPAQSDANDNEDAAAMPRGRGRPKLGVVAREVTLLPRHWDWLSQQTGGASVTIRRLVDNARRAGEDKDRIRAARESAYRFMTTMAGNRPHYEDAIRALFAGERMRFETLIAEWAADVRDHASRLAAQAFHSES